MLFHYAKFLGLVDSKIPFSFQSEVNFLLIVSELEFRFSKDLSAFSVYGESSQKDSFKLSVLTYWLWISDSIGWNDPSMKDEDPYLLISLF